MNIAVFCASSYPANPTMAHVAHSMGQTIATHGHTLIYGGSNKGLMGEVSSAAMEAGGEVVGVIPTFFGEDVIRSQHVTKLCRVANMAERKSYIIAHSDLFIALPGGIGTIDEVSEVMVANQLGLISPSTASTGRHEGKPIIILNTDGYYDFFLRQLDVMRTQGTLHSSCNLHITTTVAETIACAEELHHASPTQ